MTYSTELVGWSNDIMKQTEGLDTAPELSLLEVIVCILVRGNGNSQFIDTIALMAMQWFPKFSADHAEGVYTLKDFSVSLYTKINVCLRSYDNDFCREPIPDSAESTFTISDTSARFALRDRLSPLPEDFSSKFKKAHLSDLPPELKVQIFEYILRLPRSGAMVCHEETTEDMVRRERMPDGTYVTKVRTPRVLALLSRDFNAEVRWSDQGSHCDPVESGPKRQAHVSYLAHLPQLLALLCVDENTKELCEPIFYGKNLFHAASMLHLKDMLRDLPLSRAAHLREVSVRVQSQEDLCNGRGVFEKLTSLGVTSVGLHIDRMDWHGKRSLFLPSFPEAEYAASTEVMREVCAMGTGVDIRVEGDWKGFAEWVRKKSDAGKVTFNGEVVKTAAEKQRGEEEKRV